MKTRIIVDTREQLPLSFSKFEDHFIVERDKLDCGDYTINGHDLPNDDFSVCIERKKDCMELCQNLGTGWDRFVNEAKLLSKFKTKAIVVCSTNDFGLLYKRKWTKMHPNYINSRIQELFVRFGIPVFFLGSRENAEKYIIDIFKKCVKYREELDE